MASFCWVSQEAKLSVRKEGEEDEEVLEVSECGGGRKWSPRRRSPRRAARRLDWENIDWRLCTI